MRLSPKQQKVLLIASLSALVGSVLVLLFRQPLAELLANSWFNLWVEQNIENRPLTVDFWANRLWRLLKWVGFVSTMTVVYLKRQKLIEFWRGATQISAARYAMLLLPVLFGFLTIAIFGVNILYWDEWELPVFVNGVLEHGVKFSDFFAQHNEHRIFFPRLIILANVYISDFNTKTLMYVSWLLATLIYFLLCRYLIRITPSKTARLALGLLLGFCVFSIVQHENQLWGIEVAYYMVAAFATVSFYNFYRGITTGKHIYWAISITAAIITAFSFMSGIFILPIIIGVALLLFITEKTDKRAALKYLILLIIPAVLIIAAYFHNYHKSAFMPGTEYFNAPLSKIFAYFFSAVGSPLVHIKMRYLASYIGGHFDAGNASTIVGIILFGVGSATTIYVLIKKRVRQNLFPLCLLFFGFVFCASITAGRAGYGVGQSLTSRYTTFSLFATTGLILMVYNEFIREHSGKLLRYLAFVFLGGVAILTIRQNCDWQELQYVTDWRNRERAIVLDYRNQPLQNLNYVWPGIKPAIEIIEKRHWSIFAEQDANPSR